MFTKRIGLVILAVVTLMLAFGIGPHLAQALPPSSAGVTIPYPGRLSNDAGQSVADGVYDFNFALYDAETGGTLMWSESQTGVPVKGGAFVAALGSVDPLPAAVLDDSNRWLAVSVRGPGQTDFAALDPRQQLSAVAPLAPASPAALSCVHTHFFEAWSGSAPFGLVISNTISLPGPTFGLLARANNYFAGTPVPGIPIAIQGETSSPYGVAGAFDNLGGGIALTAQGNGSGADHVALRVNNTLTTTGMAAYLTNSSGYATVNLTNSGGGEVLYLQNNGGDFLRGVDHLFNNVFRLAANGVGHASGGWVTGGADFAEMLPAAADLEAGDVLVIGPDGQLIQSTEPYQSTVAGVYSTKPGFVGGEAVEGQSAGEIPLAVVGVVPVKVSAENGAIRPGDLLVASATPGHAMKAGANPPQGTVLGKALEGLDKGTGIIKMLATLQ